MTALISLINNIGHIHGILNHCGVFVNCCNSGIVLWQTGQVWKRSKSLIFILSSNI